MNINWNREREREREDTKGFIYYSGHFFQLSSSRTATTTNKVYLCFCSPNRKSIKFYLVLFVKKKELAILIENPYLSDNNMMIIVCSRQGNYISTYNLDFKSLYYCVEC